MRAMFRLGGADKRTQGAYPEIAQAIARASTVDPLFPVESSGAEVTAAILVAVAWHSSRLQTYSRVGPYLGLFRLRPPIEPRVSARDLFLPRTSTLFAVDLLRWSLSTMRSAPLENRLALFRDWGRTKATPSDEGVRWSRECMVGLVPRLVEQLVQTGEAPGRVTCTSVPPRELREPPFVDTEDSPAPKPKRIRKKRGAARGASA